MQRFFYSLVLFSACFVIGCGNSAVVKGTAKLADGTPIENGRVVFSNDKDQFMANIQPGGTFSPGRLQDGDGIPSGVYKIAVMGVQAKGALTSASSATPSGTAPSPQMMRQARQERVKDTLIHPRYENANTSGLTIDTSKTKTINLVLEPPQ